MALRRLHQTEAGEGPCVYVRPHAQHGLRSRWSGLRGELDGIVHCFDAKTGHQYWQHDMNADTWASPSWVDGHVYIGNDKGKILVFKHGKTKELVNTIDMNAGYVRNTPVIVNGVLYVIAENPTQLWAITKK